MFYLTGVEIRNCWTILILLVHFACSSVQERACNTPLTSTLRDDQFSASSSDDGHQPSDAKWDRDGWAAASDDIDSYLQVDFGAIYDVTAFQFTGTESGWYTESLRISYSDDGYVWTAYNSQLSDADLGEVFYRETDTTHVNFNPTLRARYVALNPIEFHDRAALSVELFGCHHADLDTNRIVTEVYGNIENNTAWTRILSPIIISGHVNVSETATLTVEAGAHVVFTNSSATIKVFGNFNVEGTDALKSVFTSNYPVLSAKSKWLGLQQTAEGNLTLTHALIRQAEHGVRATAADGLRIIDSDLMSCDVGVMLLSGSTRDGDVSISYSDDFLMRGSRVMHNTHGVVLFSINETRYLRVTSSTLNFNTYGMTLKTTTSSIKNGTYIYIVDSRLQANTRYGIVNTIAAGLNINIERCYFIGPSMRAYYSTSRYKPASVLIRDSVFTGFTSSAVELNGIHSRDQLIIVSNLFHHTSSPALDVAAYYVRADRAVVVKNNTFVSLRSNNYALRLSSYQAHACVVEDNTVVSSKGGIAIHGRSFQWIHKVTVAGNTFRDVGPSLPCVYIKEAPSNITGNTFDQCFSPSLISVPNGADHVISENRFINNTVPDCLLDVRYVIRNLYTTIKSNYSCWRDSDGYIEANRNYWGTDDIGNIKAVTCDYFINSSLSRVQMTDFYTSADMTTLVSRLDADDFRFEVRADLDAVVVGGVITSSSDTSVLTNSNMTVFVNRSIMVESGVSLELTAARFEFAENRAIIVHGYASVGSVDASTTVLTSRERDKRWDGFYIFPSDPCDANSSLPLIGDYGIYMTNTRMSDCRTCITVDTPHASSIQVIDTTVSDSSRFIYAPRFEADVTVVIDSSNIEVVDDVVEFRLMSGVAQVTVKFVDSLCTSINSRVLSVRAPLEDPVLAYVNITATESHFQSHKEVFYITPCDHLFRLWCPSHTMFDLANSTLRSTNKVALEIRASSLDATIQNNQFQSGDRSLHVYFSSSPPDVLNRTHHLTLSGNEFASTGSGSDVQLDSDPDLAASEVVNSHDIDINNNRFLHQLNKDLDALKFGRSTHYVVHRLHVDSNVFDSIGGTAFTLHHFCEELNFTNNVIVRSLCGRMCVHLDYDSSISRRLYPGPVYVTRNQFIGNSPVDSTVVYYTSRYHIDYDSLFMTRNVFEDNNATSLIMYQPYAVIQQNFFEYSEHYYTIEVRDIHRFNRNFVVNASHNYWGTSDVSEISASIYDHENADRLLTINFWPYLGSKNYSDIQEKFITTTEATDGLTASESPSSDSPSSSSDGVINYDPRMITIVMATAVWLVQRLWQHD